MRFLKWTAALALIPSVAGAQAPINFPPPGPGTPVDFVACPAFAASGDGCWMATDPKTGFTYSLSGAAPRPNVFIRVSGVVSPNLQFCPGWQLASIKVINGQQACRSEGVPGPIVITRQPSPSMLIPTINLPR